MHAALLAIAACLLIVANQGQWFFKDDREFPTHRTGLAFPGQLSVWAPHNGHWITLPVLAYKALFAAAGMRTYWPWILRLIAVHLTAVQVGWRLLGSAEVSAPLATAEGLMLAVLGSGAENLLWGFQIGFDPAVLIAGPDLPS